MARRVYLHIGTMKSGTTYLQKLLEANREHLLETGVLWPTAHRYRSVHNLFGWTDEGTENPHKWPVLAKEIRKHPGDVIFSNELLTALQVAQVRKFVSSIPGGEHHVVITARDLGRVVPSHWQTSVKNGNTHGWHEFASAVCREAPVEEPAALSEDPLSGSRFEPGPMHERFWRLHDVASIIGRWRDVVPIERITLVTVPSSRSDPEILAARFGAAVGVELTGLEQPEIESNTSLGAHSAELMRRLNELTRRGEPPEEWFGFKISLGRVSLAPRADAEPRFALSQEQQDWVVARAERMIGEIEASGVRVEGTLEDLRPERLADVGAVDPASTSDRDLLEAAQQGLIGLANAASNLHLRLVESETEREALRAEQERSQRRLDKKQRRIKKLRQP